MWSKCSKKNPYQKGFTIKVDNKEIEYKKVDNKYIGFPITSGTHTITVKYNVPGKQVGIILSIIGFICTGVVIYLEKQRRF